MLRLILQSGLYLMILFFPSNLLRMPSKKLYILHIYYIHTYNIHTSINRKGKKRSVFKKWKNREKCCSLYCRAACITRNFFKTQYPRLINKSGFKSQAAYEYVYSIVFHALVVNTNFILFILPSTYCRGPCLV